MAIEELHRLSPLEADVLVRRYLEEMDHVIGHPDRLRTNFLMLIVRLFDDTTHDRIERRVIERRDQTVGIPRRRGG